MKFFEVLLAFVLISLCAVRGTTVNDSSSGDNVAVEVQIAKYKAEFLTEFEHFMSTGQRSANFDRLLDLIKRFNIRVSLDEMPRARIPKLCLACLSASHTFLELYKKSESKGKDELVKLAQDICHLYNLKSYVCDGLIELNADMMLYVLSQLQYLPTAERVCEVAFQGEDCVATGSDLLADRYPKVRVTESPHTLKKSKEPSTRSVEDPLTIIHITDIHYDPDYEVGVNADCGSEACCRHVPDLEPADSGNAAGFWGDHRDCDTPWHAVVDVMEQIRKQHPNIVTVYFTGDIIHHFTWNTTLESNKQSMQQIFQLLKERFAGIPLYPILGNHDAHPVNLYAPHDVPEALNSKHLYEFIAKQWEDWLPEDPTIHQTIADGGYYTAITPLGYRIIALNNNPCFVYNWWLLFSDNYYIRQLQWLHDTLLEAEQAGEQVHILGHVPSYDNYCYVGWTREYRRIVERFAHIIQGQFNGHSHVDEFNVFYRKDDPTAAVNVAWNGASATTFTQLNPNYKVFYVDGENFEILDQETWIYNLTEANLTPDQPPRWFKEYSFREHYNLTDVSPRSLDQLLQRMAGSDDALFDYWRLKQKNADPMLAKGCNEYCLRETLCAVVRTEYGDDAVCDRLVAGTDDNQVEL